jgi:hypothetical protein
MEHKHNIDDLIKNVVREEGLDSPPNEFTDKLMGAIMETDREANVYKPLIPKRILLGMVSLFLLVMLVALTGGFQSQVTKIPYLDRIANSIKLPHFSIAIPTEISYILTSALIMVLIQVFIIGSLYKRMHR